MEDSTTPILESENKTYDSDHHSPLKPVKIEEASQIHSTDSPPIKPTSESNEVKTPIPKSPLSNERIKAILESVESVPRSELPPNLSSSTSQFYDEILVNLPSGWLIEQRPKTNQKYLEKIDQRKSGEANEQGSYLWDEMKKKNKRKQDCYSFDHQNPPQSVTWCLEQAEENLWIPRVNGWKVPRKVRDSWNEIFISSMNANPNPDEVFLNKAFGGK